MRLQAFRSQGKFAPGFTLVELLVALGVASVFALLIALGVNQILTKTGGVKSTQALEQHVAGILEQVAANVGQFQMNFEPQDASAARGQLNVESLAMAWSQDRLSTSAQCPECPGRLGYVINPLSGYPGLFVVTVKLTHVELLGAEGKTVQFLVSGK